MIRFQQLIGMVRTRYIYIYIYINKRVISINNEQILGRKLIKRNSDGTCEWGEKLTKQCFGLGPERKSVQGNALDANGCEQACCGNKRCTHWQETTGRGCCKF